MKTRKTAVQSCRSAKKRRKVHLQTRVVTWGAVSEDARSFGERACKDTYLCDRALLAVASCSTVSSGGQLHLYRSEVTDIATLWSDISIKNKYEFGRSRALRNLGAEPRCCNLSCPVTDAQDRGSFPAHDRTSYRKLFVKMEESEATLPTPAGEKRACSEDEPAHVAKRPPGAGVRVGEWGGGA
ncbi:hypothetical protein SKAU_G00035770 [Synaphobranchus kaupii]|uniref:Uncharacterized protein n=1 Tax=Synaphobranchus kaupii TaxID=118154 RepID=A0A9Q1JH07_SYNKA|nr:hypothetical protein SKAU_G00035770 [Synaphobranchus kaupii]